ncbi:MAG: ZIP family metal transporter [Candidatus Omnitrophica bacterium]|nr:ZIP family metal transporter [Candidatus Omnitrophota bacterium]
MLKLFYILISILIVSLISLVGIVSFFIKERLLTKSLFFVVAFSAGALLSGAFLHLIPEALEKGSSQTVFLSVLFGFLAFFILEKYLHWRHCHNGVCDIHTFTYLNLIGDAVHNFIDGMVIAVSFSFSLKVGIITTLAVIFHEIPQELGDFGVLVYGGFNKKKALFFNFLIALTAFGGAILGYFISERVVNFSFMLLAITSGGFIYIASTDLVPELHKETNLKKSSLAIIIFSLGILFMWLARKVGI